MYRSTLLFSMLLMLNCTFATNGLSKEYPYILVDVNSGHILSSNKANDRWYPASLTKLMTAYVTFRAIAAGEIKEGSPVIMSHQATRQPPSRLGYKKGVELRIDTALKIIIIKSANDVSYALAEAVAGSLSGFVDRMNSEARRLGMDNTSFANSNGLHSNSQFSSARDMALLATRIFREFPQYAHMFEAVGIATPARKHYSYNLLLERFEGANGMKTGFVCASGYNMVASATRNGRTLVAVVLGRSSQTDRAVSAAKLLNAGFRNGRTDQSVFTPVNRGANPINMRPILCTEQARAQRYDPGAGQAKITSPHLKAREISNKVLEIRTGGIDAAASDAFLSRALTPSGKVPVPKVRPNYNFSKGVIELVAIGKSATGNIPLPTPRPR